MRSHPLLEAQFKGIEDMYGRIAHSKEGQFRLAQAEQILAEATRLGVIGLEKLAKDAGGAVAKLASLIAEVRWACRFAEKGASVEILRDRAFGGDAYTPDLQLSFPSGLYALVDVIGRSHHHAPITELLDAGIKRERLRSYVQQALGGKLSESPPDGNGRDRVDDLARVVVAEALAGLKAAAANGLSNGWVHVFAMGPVLRYEIQPGAQDSFPILDDVAVRPGEECLASFVFEPSALDEGYAGGGTFGFDGDTDHARKFLSDIRHKAEKRQALPPEYSATVFLVAVENEEYYLSPTEVLSALTGARSWPPHSRPLQHPRAVEAAYRTSWKPLLDEWDYGPNSRYRMTNYGAFGDGDCPWAREISGVLVWQSGDLVVRWFPNPFARPEICDPRLLEIGFSVRRDGTRSLG
jgi:hypothetical protein